MDISLYRFKTKKNGQWQFGAQAEKYIQEAKKSFMRSGRSEVNAQSHDCQSVKNWCPRCMGNNRYYRDEEVVIVFLVLLHKASPKTSRNGLVSGRTYTMPPLPAKYGLMVLV